MKRLGLKKCAVVAVCACALLACERVVYSDCRSLPDGWDKDSVLSFPFAVDDVDGLYQTQLIVRNTDDYKNQNLWLFVEQSTPNGTTTRDTVQYFLADKFGRWLGSGIGSIHENVCIYQPRVRYRTAGSYTLRVAHGMRYNNLDGICELGVKIVKLEQ